LRNKAEDTPLPISLPGRT